MSQAQKEHDYLLGQSVGLDEAARMMMDRAIQMFKIGNDEGDRAAKLFRQISEDLSKRAKDRHPRKS